MDGDAHDDGHDETSGDAHARTDGDALDARGRGRHGFNASGYVRRARRRGDLNQRELAVHAVPERPTIAMLMHDREPIPAGGSWHHGRIARDRLRREKGQGADVEQLTETMARERRAGVP